MTAYLPTTGKVSLAWRSRPTIIEDLEPLAFAETTTIYAVGEGVLRAHSKVVYRIVQGKYEAFEIGIPEGLNILKVEGADLKDWRIVEGKLRVELHEGEDESYELYVEGEKLLGALPVEVELRGLEVLGVERERGHVGVSAVEEVKVEGIEIEGLSQVNIEELPKVVDGAIWQGLVTAYK